MKIDTWVKRAIAGLSPEIRDSFAMDPIRTLREHFELTVREVDHLGDRRGSGGACDGLSYLDHRVVLYAPSPGSKRKNFTLAHELGHWLVEKNEAVFGWVADQESAPQVLETLCDGIAQKLLLPDDLVDSIVMRPVRAAHVIELYEGSAASVPACAVAVTTRLQGLGAVTIVDRWDMKVSSASVHPDPERGWPAVHPWPGDTLEATHALYGLEPGEQFSRHSFWRNRWGRREDYFIDAVATDRRICAVLSGTDIWGIEDLPTLIDRDFDRRPLGSFFHCGEWRTVRGFPCSRCAQSFCPACGGCRCNTVTSSEAHCAVCNGITPAHLLVDGKCELCA